MIRSKLIWLTCLALLPAAAGIHAQEPIKKFRVKSVVFEGNISFSDKKLKRLMLTRPYNFFPRFYYYPEVLEDDLKNLVMFYQQNGYL
ncbi:MAG: hypothetical protein JXB45_09215 [Candidatus Krumholzibacteriota bacterium]|nr:hypothetical protein [Candidatus Krumholzibacteriota bacterium]